MSLEDDIRTALLDKRRALPGWPDAAERVHAGMSRRLRRRRLATAIAGFVALAFAVPLTLLQTNGGLARTADGAVPWGGDIPLSTSAPTAPVPGGLTPPCTPDDLAPQAIVRPAHASAAGVSMIVVGVRNVGTERCAMDGMPVVYSNEDGTWRPAPASEVSFSADPSAAGIEPDAVIGPNEVAFVRIERSFGCPPVPGGPGGFPLSYNDLALGIGAARLPAPGASLPGVCGGLAVSDWFVPRKGDNPALDGLVATITQAGPARAGHLLDFVVALTNPGREPVDLRPAAYYATLVGSSTVIYQLRSTPAAIPARGVVTYEMRVDLPADMPLGPTRLTWQLGTIGADVGAAIPITVTR